MDNKELHNFTFVSTFLTDIMSLPYEQRCKIIDAIVYWGVYRELPQEIEGDALSIALLKNAQRMIEGQDKYKEAATSAGKKGGRVSAITDEQILGAYVELFKKNGYKPTEQEVIDYCGGGVKRIGTRNAWKRRDQYLYECMKTNDTIHTNVWNESYKDTYNTYKDTYNIQKSDNESNESAVVVCMESKKETLSHPFDF